MFEVLALIGQNGVIVEKNVNHGLRKDRVSYKKNTFTYVIMFLRKLVFVRWIRSL